jgi:hypothetical protein
MNFNISPKPDPLAFGEGMDHFKLHVKPITGEERMCMLDAVRSNSLVDIQSAVERMVIGWDGVQDENGHPVPFEFRDGTITKNRFDQLLGSISCELQLRVIGGLLAFVGIPAVDIGLVIRAFGGEETIEATAPTPPPGDAMLTNASGG